MNTVFMPMLASVLILFVSAPMVAGMVPRNRLYGFRTRATLSSDAIWYPANRMAGSALLRAGLLSFIGCIIAKVLFSEPTALKVGLTIMMISVLVATVVSFVKLKNLLRS